MAEFQSSIIFKTLYYYEKILGLCPFVMSKQTLEISYLGVIYNLIMSILYTSCFIFIIDCRFELRLPRETTLTITMDALGLLFQYCTVVCTWLTVILGHNKLKIIYHKFENIQELAKTMKITVYQNKLKKLLCVTIRLFIVNVSYLTIFCLDHYSLSMYKKFQEQASAWAWFNVPKIVMYNVCAIFLEIMLILQQIFGALNKSIARFLPSGIHEFRNISSTSNVLLKLHEIGQLHDSLSELLEQVSNFFGLSILFAIIATFIHSFLDIYAVYQYLIYKRLWEISDFGIYSLTIIWMMTKFITIYFVCGVPDSTCAEVR